jgi:hypothetical protein
VLGSAKAALAGDRERQRLTEVAEDQLQIWVVIEHAAHDQAQRVRPGLDSECPGGTQQLRTAIEGADVSGEWIARVKVERHVQPLHGRPEVAVLRLVVVGDGVRVDLAEPVHERPDEPEVADGPLEFSSGRVGVLRCGSSPSALLSRRSPDSVEAVGLV